LLCAIARFLRLVPLELPRREHRQYLYGNPVYRSTSDPGKLPFSIRIETGAATAV